MPKECEIMLSTGLCGKPAVRASKYPWSEIFWACPEHADEADTARKNKARRDRDQVRRDCGLVRGRDSLGRVIWE